MRPRDMGVLFEEAAAAHTRCTVHLDRPFDIAPDAGTTYHLADLAALVTEAAGWLAAAGARRGERVAIVKDNHWDYDLLACAAVRVGAVPAQLSDHLDPATLATLLGRLDARVLVTTDRVLAQARGAGVDLTALAATTVTLDPRSCAAVPVDELRGHRPPAPVRRSDDEPLVINHTSGTTGVPKLVVHSTRTIIGKLARFEAVRIPKIGVRRDDTVANASAYAHGRTFCWTAVALCLAPRRVLVITGQDPHRVDPLLRAHPPTIMEGLPASYVRLRPLTERLDNPFRDVRLFLSTYDAMHPPTVRAYLHASGQRSPLWMEGWGQTETGPLSFRFHSRRSLDRARGRAGGAGGAGGGAGGAGGHATRDLGWPVPGKTRLAVVDPDTMEPVPRGRPGLVLARTSARCLDYVGESRRWAQRRVGRWWVTGDLGVHRRDGGVLLLDREVDRIHAGSCLEIEDLVEDRIPEVRECVVLACSGAPPLPVVVTSDGALSGAAWRQAVAGLPAMQDPVVLTWEELPRTGTGKVRRRALLKRLTGSDDVYGSGRWA